MMAPAYLDKIDAIAGVLSQIISTTEQLIAIPPTSDGVAVVKDQIRPGADYLPQIAMFEAAIKDARAIVLEGGNPLGEASPMLVEVLGHLERARRTDLKRADRWAQIAFCLLVMVRQELGLALERKRAPVEPELGRFR